MASGVQLARWAVAAGWRNPADTTKAVAIAMRAGSDPDAPGGLYGIGQGRDGASQSAAAYMLWSSRNEDWSVFPPYQDGAWRLNLPAAAAAVAALPAAEAVETVKDSAGTVGQGLTAVGDLTAGAGRIVAFITSDKAWERMLKVGIGSALVVISIAYVTKRGTLDQGVRFLRFVGRNADFIHAARAGGATRPGTGRPAAAPPKARATRPAKAVRPRRAEPRSWADAPTEPRPVVGTAKRQPQPLPGDKATPRTGLHRREGRPGTRPELKEVRP